MSTEFAFVGDVHGNLKALLGIWDALTQRRVEHVVFLGDYINKGAQSAGVIQALMSYSDSGHATLLAGNHETALLDAIDREDLSDFLKIGGAATIRSYVMGSVGPNVLEDFLISFPPAHLETLRRMPSSFETADLIAQHVAPNATVKFRISAHVPVGDVPRIGKRSAQLDTGCGAASGLLTAFLWPDLDYLQVDDDGVAVES